MRRVKLGDNLRTLVTSEKAPEMALCSLIQFLAAEKVCPLAGLNNRPHHNLTYK